MKLKAYNGTISTYRLRVKLEELPEPASESQFDKSDDATVDLIASGYEWTCPNCEAINTIIESNIKVTCPKCGKTFEAMLPTHV